MGAGAEGGGDVVSRVEQEKVRGLDSDPVSMFSAGEFFLSLRERKGHENT